MSSSAYDNFVDIILTDAEVELSLENCGIIFDIDESIPIENRRKRETWTLFEAVAIQKDVRLETKTSALRSRVQALEDQWGKTEFHTVDAKEFFKMFKLNIQIWNIGQTGRRNIIREKIFDRFGMPKLIGKFSIRSSFSKYFFSSEGISPLPKLDETYVKHNP